MVDATPSTEHPLVARIKQGQVPDAAKLSAAKGLLPIPAEDLVGLLVFLSTDPSRDVRGNARQTLADFPEEQLRPILTDDACRVEVLEYFAANPRSDVVSEALLLNPGTPDEAIERLAGVISPRLLDILIRNEVRLIRHSPIIARIEANPNASPAVIRRAEEIRTDFIAKQVSVARPVVEKPAEPEAPEAPAAVEAVAEVEVPAEASAIEAQALAAPVSDALKEIFSLESQAEEDPEPGKKQTLEQKIMKLSVPEKIKLAYLGGRQARMLLIKEPNRTVSNAVLNGGKISQQEVELLVQFRNIDDDILRRIAATKQWMKVYNIVHNLVKNPRTPLGVTMTLIGRLQLSDLKRLENNNNVSGMVREQAKKLARQAQSQQKK